jgi:hypothetical protein
VGARGVEMFPWARGVAGAAAAARGALPPCPDGDVTGASRAAEWARRCLADACPPWAPWGRGGGAVGGGPARARGAAWAAAGLCARPGDARVRALRVHIDNAAAQSGVSRFGEGWEGARTWVFDKTEGLNASAAFANFDALIAENVTLADGVSTSLGVREAAGFMVAGGDAGVVRGAPRLRRRLADWPRLGAVETEPVLYIMVRRPDA